MERKRDYAGDYTPQELLAVAAARELRNCKTVFAGIGLPCLSALLAKFTVRLDLVIVVESGCVAPQPRRLMLSITDSACAERAVATMSLYRVFSDCQRGFFDAGIIGAAQVDKYGNVNSTVIIGDKSYDKPLVRLIGSGGANDLASSIKRFIVMTRLERRRFPMRVDYISSPGHIKPGEREKLKLRGEGPSAVITDKCIFRFDPKTKEMYLDSLHPGVKVEDVKREIQWELKVADKVKTTEPPTIEEVEILRALDPLKIYLGEGPEKVDFPSYIRMLEESYEKFRDRIHPFSM